MRWDRALYAASVIGLWAWALFQTYHSDELEQELLRVTAQAHVVGWTEDEMASTVIPAWGYKENGVCKIIGPTTVTQQPGETLAEWTARVRATRQALEAEFPPDPACPSTPPEPQDP